MEPSGHPSPQNHHHHDYDEQVRLVVRSLSFFFSYCVQVLLGQVKEGAEDLEKAMALSPANIAIAFSLGEALMQQERWADADAMFTRSVTSR